MKEKIRWKLIEWLGGGTRKDYVSRQEYELERMKRYAQEKKREQMYPDCNHAFVQKAPKVIEPDDWYCAKCGLNR